MASPSSDHLRGKSLAELKHLAKLEDEPKGSNKKTSIKSWSGSGQNLIQQAAQLQDQGDYESAYVYLRKAANIALFLSSDHPDRAKPDIKPILSSYLATTTGEPFKTKMRQVEQVLNERDKTRGVSNGLSSSSTPASPTSEDPPPAPMSIKERMAALKGAGMDTGPSLKRMSKTPTVVSMPTPPPRPSTPPPPPTSFLPPATHSSQGLVKSASSSSSSSLRSPAQRQDPLPPPPTTNARPLSSPSSENPPELFSPIPTPFKPQQPTLPSAYQPSPPAPFISHSHSASLPPPRHYSPPPISSKPASLSATKIAASKPPPPPIPSSIDEASEDQEDHDRSFSNHFPSITEFESQPLAPLSPSTTTPTAVSSLEDRFANLLPSVPSNVPGSPLPSPSPSTSSLPPPPTAPGIDFQKTGSSTSSFNSVSTPTNGQAPTPTPLHHNHQHPSPPVHKPMFSQQNSASTPNLASLNNANGFSPNPPSNNFLPTQLSGSSITSNGSGPRILPKQKIDFPLSNTIFPSVLRRYIDSGVKLLLLDVRREDAFAKGHVGTIGGRSPSGEALDVVRVDPEWLGDYGLNSAKLLTFLPPNSQPLFSARASYDLVVVYDRDSTPTSPTATAVNTLVSVIYEREFTSATLKRAPVVMLGGYDAFVAEMKRPPGGGGSPLMGAGGDGGGLPRSARMPVDGFMAASSSSSFDSGSEADKRMSRGPSNGVSRSSIPSLSTIPHGIASPPPISTSFTYPTPPLPAASSSSRYPASLSSSSSQNSFGGPTLASPPAASIAFSPLSRRRSDYADQASQPYSGYQPPSGHTSRASISYPTLSKEHEDVAPKMPEQAATPTLERHASSRGTLVRSASTLSREGGPSGGDKGDEVRYWGDEIVGMSGLKNLGNTCYQNSTLQCLSATAPFTTFFRDGRWKRSVNMTNPLGTKGNLASAYSSLVSALWHQEYHFIQPLSFRKQIVKFAPAFDGNEQHDSQEFLAFLLDGLHEDLNRVQVRPPAQPMTPEREAELNTLPPQIASEKEWKAYQTRNDSLVVDWFQGQYRSKVECQTCHSFSISYDTFMYLSLPVPTGRMKHKVSLEHCLDGFVKEEIMEKDNAWNCPKCKKARTASKSLSLSRLPPVLLIHLKRFSSKNGVFWDKAETLVEFPVRSLDLTKYLPPPLASSGPDSYASSTKQQLDPRDQTGPFVYELYAVSNHSGSLSGGHYTAFVKASRRHWKYCDDRTISEADEKDLVSKNAYILFYRRVPTKRSVL